MKPLLPRKSASSIPMFEESKERMSPKFMTTQEPLSLEEKDKGML